MLQITLWKIVKTEKNMEKCKFITQFQKKSTIYRHLKAPYIPAAHKLVTIIFFQVSVNGPARGQSTSKSNDHNHAGPINFAL